jgi:predicted O-methyltransferase YrrM
MNFFSKILNHLRPNPGPPPKLWKPPGHFYSPIPGDADIAVMEKKLSVKVPESIPGIKLNLDEQKELLKEFERYYRELPFPETKNPELRYFYENPNYLYSDAIFLHCMIRHFRPGRIIEVGSGYSSCCILDTNERFFDDAITCTFLEPYPELLLSLIRPEDEQRLEIIPRRLQEVDIDLFDRLGENDLLVIDSTHVLKTGSDVERLFAEILPRLQPGVLIHFHDIFYPFEYPRNWVLEGRAWNEIYALRSFLQYNETFRIVIFNTCLEQLMPEYFAEKMPLCLKNTGGSIWLRKEC